MSEIILSDNKLQVIAKNSYPPYTYEYIAIAQARACYDWLNKVGMHRRIDGEDVVVIPGKLWEDFRQTVYGEKK
jgi:hypothetical protein